MLKMFRRRPALPTVDATPIAPSANGKGPAA